MFITIFFEPWKRDLKVTSPFFSFLTLFFLMFLENNKNEGKMVA